MCERELETEQNCNILILTLLALTVFLSRSSGLLNRGPGGPASLGHVLIPASSPTGLVSKLTDFLSSLSYIIVQRPLLLVGVTVALIQPILGQGYNSDISRPDAPVIYIGAFLILTVRLDRRSIYNTSSDSISRRWLRLKAATLNRCQLYNIIKLPEFIFSIKF